MNTGKQKEIEMNGDKITTILGGIGSVVIAAEPITRAVGEGSLHQDDYVKLVIAVLTAIFGFFTNRK
ncbi:MAG: hypothetical protein HGA87_01025 [Desulfobulbaceae bacterium]|nr:hypothetical protein [Desulfobulbaceae bacterium]